MSVTTYPSAGRRSEIESVRLLMKKRVGVATNVYLRKTLGKPKGGL